MTFNQPSADIIKSAALSGFMLTPKTLARWHRDGLVPTPVIRRLGKGRGTESLYPMNTKRQVAALLQIRSNYRNLEEVGFRLWLAGYPVSDRYSFEYLSRAALEFDKKLDHLRAGRAKLFSDDGNNDELVEKLWTELAILKDKRLPIKFVQKIRKRVGRENFDAALIIILDIVTGNFDGFSEDNVRDQILRKMLGADNVRKSLFNGAFLWLLQTLEFDMIDLSKLFQGKSFFHTIDYEEKASLLQSRQEFFEIFFGLSRLGKLAVTYQRIKLPVLFRLSEVTEHAKTFDLAWMLLVWCRMRNQPWASGYREIISKLYDAGILASPSASGT